MKSLLLVSALALSIGTAAAAPGPTDILGMKLGEAIAFPECAAMKYPGSMKPREYVLYASERDSTPPCWENEFGGHGKPLDPNFAEVKFVLVSDAIPSAFDGGYIRGVVVSGKLERIVLGTYGGAHQMRALETLKAKYGAPTTEEMGETQNAMGAKFATVDATWRFDNLQVLFNGLAGSVKSGIVVISTPAGDAAVEAKEAADRAKEPKL